MMSRFVIAFAFAVLLTMPGLARASAIEGQKLALAIDAMENDDWGEAQRLARSIQNPAAAVYVEWRRLRGQKGRWPEFLVFLDKHEDWPGLPLMRRAGEILIPKGRPADEIIKFSLEQTGQNQLAYDTIKRAWLTFNLSDSNRKDMLRRYPKTLGKSHWTRVDNLIWDGQFTQATKVLNLVSSPQKRLAEARIALRRGKNGVNKLIDEIPEKLLDDPGLAYDRFRWRLRKDKWEGGEEILLASSVSREALGRPSAWSHRRAMTSRRAMRDRRYETAYKMASSHFLRPSEAGYIDLEWLSGYLKLIYLNDAEKAIEHFRNLRQRAVTPITQGRVWYWLGRAHERAQRLVI